MDVTGFVVYFSDRAATQLAAATTCAERPATSPTVAGGVEVTYGDDPETGELGFEDIINTDANSTPNNQLDHPFTDVDGNNRCSEDLNWELPIVPAANAPGRGTLQTYGGAARLLPASAVDSWRAAQPDAAVDQPRQLATPNAVGADALNGSTTCGGERRLRLRSTATSRASTARSSSAGRSSWSTAAAVSCRPTARRV